MASYQIQRGNGPTTSRRRAPRRACPSYIKDPAELKALTAYFGWAAWATCTNRPGRDYSYTNNWPYEPLVGNTPTPPSLPVERPEPRDPAGRPGADPVRLRQVRLPRLGGRARSGPAAHLRPPKALALTPSQWATGALLRGRGPALPRCRPAPGGGLAHYRVEPGAFYGFDLARFLPYNLARTWHLQLAIFWIATAWVGGGLFLAPLVGGEEPKGQRLGVYALLGALALVVFGSLFGEYLGINDRLGNLWFWFGHQGIEYLDLGRFWQVLLAAGLIFWLFLMFRALAPAMKIPEQGELASLFLYAAVAIPLFYVPALFYGPHTNFAIIDNWRFWIIHLWVEGFFELFATVLVAVMFYQLGLVTREVGHAPRLPGRHPLPGRGHRRHGPPLVLHGPGHPEHGPRRVLLRHGGRAAHAAHAGRLGLHPAKDRVLGLRQDLAAKQKWAIYFLMAVGVWNFVGAGVFGFLINLPIVSYFEIGTTLTANHGHAAMFGVFGMLALAVLVFCLRAMQSDEAWAKREVRQGRLLGPQHRPGSDDPAGPLPRRACSSSGTPSPTATGTAGA